MSAAAPGLTKRQKKALKREFFNAIEAKNASGVSSLIPRLAENGIDLNVDLEDTGKCPEGIIYPILLAIHNNASDVLGVLITGGANINIIRNCYMVKADKGDYEYCGEKSYNEDNEDYNDEYKRLIKNKVLTPLRYAVQRNNDNAIRVLLEAGAQYPDENDYRNENNNYNNNENNNYNNNENTSNDYPTGYYGMIDELMAELRNWRNPFPVRTFEYIFQNHKRLGVSHTDILDIFYRNIKNIRYVRSFTDLLNLIYTKSDDKYNTYRSLVPYIFNLRNPVEFFKFVFTNGIKPNTVDEHGETVLFMYASPIKPAPDVAWIDIIDERVNIIKWLITLGVNPYIPNNTGETPAVRAIKQRLPKPIIDALNVRSLDNIYELRETNPYLVNKLATKFTKANLRNTPKSYVAMLTRALADNNVRDNARIAFRPANIPNITGRTGKNYQKMKRTQHRRAAEMRGPTTGGSQHRANLNRTRRRTLKATKPL
jgi:ankyrin repeat protein